MVQPTDRHAVVLEAQQWQQVMEQLVEGKFRIVMPLIQAIQQQLMAAAAESDAARPGVRVPGGMNGAEAPHE
jgi:hypothetical protein